MLTMKDGNNDYIFELRQKPGRDLSNPVYFKGTFVHLAHLIGKGMTFGDDLVDTLILMQGSIYEDEFGVSEDASAYALHMKNNNDPSKDLNEIIPEEKSTIEIPEFLLKWQREKKYGKA